MHAASVLKVSMEFHSGFPSPGAQTKVPTAPLVKHIDSASGSLSHSSSLYHPHGYTQSCGWRKLREVMDAEIDISDVIQ